MLDRCVSKITEEAALHTLTCLQGNLLRFIPIATEREDELLYSRHIRRYDRGYDCRVSWCVHVIRLYHFLILSDTLLEYVTVSYISVMPAGQRKEFSNRSSIYSYLIRGLSQQLIMPLEDDTVPSCKVVQAGAIAKDLLSEISRSRSQLLESPLLVGFLANNDPAARSYAEWTSRTCIEK